jgi:hypothetical protein
MHAGRSNWAKNSQADMARLPPSTCTYIITKNIFFSKQPAGTTPTLNLTCFTRKAVCFTN